MIPTVIVVHHTASGPDTTIAQINDWHKARDFTLSSLNYYIGYHYVIARDGTITQTRRDNEMGCHTIPNDGKLGICLIGNFMTDFPTSQQTSALANLVNQKIKLYNITKVGGHRDWSRTECPGDHLIVPVLQNEVGLLQYLINKIKTVFTPHV